ncbi:MAG: alanine--tRNA ligase [Bacteroidales bacterium]|nr:alanine--tRNA ligase [Bacteroidales bacterium]
MPSSSEIRQQFLDFFCQKHGHTFVPSSPVVPHDDPTLLFANAGMNQFKPYFLGTEKPPYKRAVNTQKCIRAGGKHNDLDDVGKDTYHHTFFEMLGNWSFGDYFKKEAIAWAWELLTTVWKLDPTRLHVTVFEGDPANGIPRDDEAAGFWRAVGVPDSHIHLGNKKDNFWEMGNTGPCGPCTEIHYDSTPDKSGATLVNAGTDKVIEIWNNVFIQFNRNEDQSLTPLPAQHVDTGMGFERITKILQGKDSNYDTDIFTPIFAAIQQVTGARPYGGKLDDLIDTAYRVIADHMRMLTFAITDGGTPSNKGRGAVVRSVLRRAERYGWQVLGMKEPFLHKLVPAVVALMEKPFPELGQNPAKVRELIYDEEQSFLRTLDRGIKHFTEASEHARQAQGVISGKDAFELHTTHGVYIEITEQMAAEAGLRVDRAEYERLFEAFQITSAGEGNRLVISAVQGELPTTDDTPKYGVTPIQATVIGWVRDNTVIRTGTLPLGEPVALLLDRTPFYAEQGGQVGDIGRISSTGGADFEVEDTQRLGDTVLHIGRLTQGKLTVGDTVQPMQSTFRRIDIMRNHTATHLMNLALRQVLGNHVDQKGSLVDEDKTRFDFSHDKPLSAEELRAIEQRVNTLISRDQPVTARTMPLTEAKAIPGVRAMFGEKYPDPVRVVLVGPDTPEQAAHDDSVEFCGGTHVPRTGLIGYFKIIEQGGVAKGIRRVTAVTGRKALETLGQISAVVEDLSARFNCKLTDLPTRVEALQEEVKRLQQQLKKGLAADLAGTIDTLIASAPVIGGAKLIVGQLPGGSVDQVRTQIDRIRQKLDSALIVLGWAEEEKVSIVVALTHDLVAKGLKAGELIKPLAATVGGKGGGKPELAQAGGKDAAKLPEAIQKAAELGQTELTKVSV